jgi:hypothetical protein
MNNTSTNTIIIILIIIIVKHHQSIDKFMSSVFDVLIYTSKYRRKSKLYATVLEIVRYTILISSLIEAIRADEFCHDPFFRSVKSRVLDIVNMISVVGNVSFMNQTNATGIVHISPCMVLDVYEVSHFEPSIGNHRRCNGGVIVAFDFWFHPLPDGTASRSLRQCLPFILPSIFQLALYLI